MRQVTFDDIKAMNLAPLRVKKDKPVHARPAKLGEQVTTWGYCPTSTNFFAETHVEVKEEGAWVVRQELHTPVGTYHNEYVVVGRKFDNLYDHVEGETFHPKPGPDKVVYQVEEDLEFPYPTFWNQEGLFALKAGGYLVPEDGEFYGINQFEFEATHSIL